MKKNIFCEICQKKAKSKKVITRSKKKIDIFICKSCDFEFFIKEKKVNLKNNKLDKFRLKNAGLNINKQKKDISNGLNQAEEYIKKHLKNKKNLKILDIGCSWGYFLSLCKKKGHEVYGLEINEIRKNYVNNKLKLKCYETIQNLPEIKFDKIFLFYSLEYISKPQEYIILLKQLLKKNGEIIIYTPNKNDHINKILNLKSYKNFFYEENSINYFSKNSLIKIAKNSKSKFKIELNQGYGLVNFLNWFYHKKPFDTGFVGKDNFIKDLINHLRNNNKNNQKFIKKLIPFLKNIDEKFKSLIIENNLSNTIIFKIKC